MKQLVTIKFGPLECVKGLDFPPGDYPDMLEVDFPKEDSRRNMDLVGMFTRKDSIIDGTVPVFELVALKPKEMPDETRDPEVGS